MRTMFDGGGSSLPAQPIPDLSATMSACLTRVSPFLAPWQRTKTRAILRLYALASARHQRALVANKSTDTKNWCAEGVARLYLGCRHPLPLNNNYPLVLTDDPAATGPSERAARLIAAALVLQDDILHERMSVDLESGVPLEMAQYRCCYATSREASNACDNLITYEPSHHIVVLRKGIVYKLPVARSSVLEEIEQSIDWIVNDADASSADAGVSPTWLTAASREQAARIRATLLEGRENAATLQTVERALFVVCLDDASPGSHYSASALVRDGSAESRWYDKSLQIVVFENGIAGLNFEHAAVDGHVANGFAHHLQRVALELQPVGRRSQTSNHSRPSAHVERLVWSIDEGLCKQLTAVRKRFLQAIESRISDSWQYRVDIARFAQLRAAERDALVQLAIQVASKEHFGRVHSVLEPVHVRNFSGGRLDFIASVTPESLAFVTHAFESGDAALLKRAVSAHRASIRDVKEGKGVINHLLALAAREFPQAREKGVASIRRRQDVLAKVDKGLELTIRQEIMAANGSGAGHVAVFGTTTSQPEMFGIGYIIHEDGNLTFDVRADGEYRHAYAGFRQRLEVSLDRVFALADVVSEPQVPTIATSPSLAAKVKLPVAS